MITSTGLCRLQLWQGSHFLMIILLMYTWVFRKITFYQASKNSINGCYYIIILYTEGLVALVTITSLWDWKGQIIMNRPQWTVHVDEFSLGFFILQYKGANFSLWLEDSLWPVHWLVCWLQVQFPTTLSYHLKLSFSTSILCFLDTYNM